MWKPVLLIWTSRIPELNFQTVFPSLGVSCPSQISMAQPLSIQLNSAFSVSPLQHSRADVCWTHMKCSVPDHGGTVMFHCRCPAASLQHSQNVVRQKTETSKLGDEYPTLPYRSPAYHFLRRKELFRKGKTGCNTKTIYTYICCL